MTIEGGTAIVLTYVLVSIGVIIAFLLAVFVIGWLIGRLRVIRRRRRDVALITRVPSGEIAARR